MSNAPYPQLYYANGKPPYPPAGGWKTIDWNAHYVHDIIKLLRSGNLKRNTSPCDIWHMMPIQYRVLDPRSNWRRMIRYCKEEADRLDKGKLHV